MAGVGFKNRLIIQRARDYKSRVTLAIFCANRHKKLLFYVAGLVLAGAGAIAPLPAALRPAMPCPTCQKTR